MASSPAERWKIFFPTPGPWTDNRKREIRLDFALWKKADPAHIMRWSSQWGEGYPGLAPGMLGHEYQVPGNAV